MSNQQSGTKGVMFIGGPWDAQIKAMKNLPPTYPVSAMEQIPLTKPESRLAPRATHHTIIQYNLHWFQDTNGQLINLYVSEDFERQGVMAFLLNMYREIGGSQ